MVKGFNQLLGLQSYSCAPWLVFFSYSPNPAGWFVILSCEGISAAAGVSTDMAIQEQGALASDDSQLGKGAGYGCTAPPRKFRRLPWLGTN